MTEKTTLSFAISQEEAVVVMAYLGVKEMLGLDMRMFTGLSEDNHKMVMGVAERALFARGFLTAGDDGALKLSDPVHALLRACTNPDATLVVRTTYPERPDDQYFFHLARKMAVLHTIPVTAIHQFMAVENRQVLAQSALSALNIMGIPELTLPGGKVHQKDMEAARNAGKEQGETAAANILTTAGLSHATALELAKLLASGGLNHSVLFAHHTGGKNVEMDGFALIGGATSLWMLKQAEDANTGNDLVEVRPTGATEIGKLIKNWIA